MSCIPSFLNEERDSFPIGNAEEWRGSTDHAALAEGLHELQAREFRRQRNRDIVPLTKETVIMTEDSQVRVRQKIRPKAQYSIHSS